MARKNRKKKKRFRRYKTHGDASRRAEANVPAKWVDVSGSSYNHKTRRWQDVPEDAIPYCIDGLGDKHPLAPITPEGLVCPCRDRKKPGSIPSWHANDCENRLSIVRIWAMFQVLSKVFENMDCNQEWESHLQIRETPMSERFDSICAVYAFLSVLVYETQVCGESPTQDDILKETIFREAMIADTSQLIADLVTNPTPVDPNWEVLPPPDHTEEHKIDINRYSARMVALIDESVKNC